MSATLAEHGRLSAVLVKHARDAFVSGSLIADQWRWLNFSAPPDLGRAAAEHDAFIACIAASGAEVVGLPPNESATLDSIYTRDSSVVGPHGVILGSMGKPQRATEPSLQETTLRQLGWPIAGAVGPPGRIEGGDLVWLDSHTVAVGQGARTNAEGIRQLSALLNDAACDIVVVPLPDYPGQHDVMHLMSLVSPVDRDLAVVYAPLLPGLFRRTLQERGYCLIDVPDAEFDTMGTNVLALGPRDCVMLEGNPRTRAALERAGARVQVYEGREISLKGGGGPTCLTRPLRRVVGGLVD
jgi:N-dimethylarginine dimethylaminohydrolase